MMLVEINELLKLEEFKEFSLLNKSKTLHGFIRKTGILDYETKEMVVETFGEDELVITTLLAYKDNIDDFFQVLKEIVIKGGALAIKEVYFNTLPDYMLKFCDENNFPVFVFDTTYFEDIVTVVDRVAKNGEINQLLLDKINLILYGDYSREKIKSISRSINRNFANNYYVFSCRRKDGKYISYINDLKNLGTTIINYHDMILIIYSRDEFKNRFTKDIVMAYIKSIGMDVESLSIGISSLFKDLENMDRALIESMSALRYCTTYGEDISSFSDMGVDRFLIPCRGNRWGENYSRSIIDKIIENNKNNMFDTVKNYVVLGGDIKEVAKAMFQHENTIRYRLERLKDILSYKGSDMEFFCELSVAMKIYLNEEKHKL